MAKKDPIRELTIVSSEMWNTKKSFSYTSNAMHELKLLEKQLQQIKNLIPDLEKEMEWLKSIYGKQS
jgi:hypothetical protein